MLVIGTRSHESSLYIKDPKQTQGPTKCAGSMLIIMLKEPRDPQVFKRSGMPLVSQRRHERMKRESGNQKISRFESGRRGG
jgi:hypothetical protein